MISLANQLQRKKSHCQWQVNFDEINIENCYRSGCKAIQNKKMAEKIKFLREEISEKKNYYQKFIFVEMIQP